MGDAFLPPWEFLPGAFPQRTNWPQRPEVENLFLLLCSDRLTDIDIRKILQMCVLVPIAGSELLS